MLVVMYVASGYTLPARAQAPCTTIHVLRAAGIRTIHEVSCYGRIRSRLIGVILICRYFSKALSLRAMVAAGSADDTYRPILSYLCDTLF